MSGPQFIHLQTFSRKPNPAGQSVAQILGEVLRTPEFSHHVDAPAPPGVVDGITPPELIARHDAMIENAKVVVKVKGKTHHRAIRKDRHTLMTAVSSYPIPWDQIEGTPEEEAALRQWEERNVTFFKKLFGGQYQATYRHTDEAFPHLHIYALPERSPGVDASRLHPGKNAKAKAEALALKEKATARESVAAGNRALKASMRNFQNVYYKHVGEPCGLLRIGPKRQRLSRKDYMAQKEAARLRSASTLEARSSDLARREAELSEASEGAVRQLDKLAGDSADMEARNRALSEREAQVVQNAKRVVGYVKRLHDLISAIGGALGLGAFKSVRDGLARLEEAVETLQSEMQHDPGAPDEGDQSPSW